MDSFAFAIGEDLLREDDAVFVRSWLARFPGRLCLTNHRMVFLQTEFLDVPLAETLRLKHANYVRAVLPRDNLVSVEIGRARRKETALVVKSSDGFTYKFLTAAIDDWRTALERAIAQDAAAVAALLERLQPPGQNPEPFRGVQTRRPT